MSENQPDTEQELYDLCVQVCLESNSDQSYRNERGEYEPYDEASAMAAVDSMLDDVSGSLTEVLAILRGER